MVFDPSQSRGIDGGAPGENGARYRTGNDGHLHDAVDGLGPFLGWLLRRGYRVLHTAAEQPIVFYDLPKAD